jgi:hypothetical protein
MMQQKAAVVYFKLLFQLLPGESGKAKAKSKVKLSLCLTKHQDMKTYWGGGIAPCILDLGTRRRRVIIFMPRPLYPQGKITRYPLDRRLGRLQNRSGRGGEDRNSQPPPGIEQNIKLNLKQGVKL